MHIVIQVQSFRRKPKKLKSLFSRNKQRSKDIKHFTTASEIKSYQGHLQKHKPQEMITQYACNKPASWPLNIRLSAAKTRFTQSKFRILQLVLHCVVLVNFAREKKGKRTTVQADSQGHVSQMHREAVHSKWLPPLSLCEYFWKEFALKWDVSFDLLWV